MKNAGKWRNSAEQGGVLQKRAVLSVGCPLAGEGLRFICGCRGSETHEAETKSSGWDMKWNKFCLGSGIWPLTWLEWRALRWFRFVISTVEEGKGKSTLTGTAESSWRQQGWSCTKVLLRDSWIWCWRPLIPALADEGRGRKLWVQG